MTLDLNAIEQRMLATPPGEWESECAGSEGYYVQGLLPDESLPLWKRHKYLAQCFHLPFDESRAFAEFIAHARDDIESLIAEVRRLRNGN